VKKNCLGYERTRMHTNILATGLGFFPCSLLGDSIIFSAGNGVGGGGIATLGGNLQQIIAEGWTDSVTETNVSISVTVGNTQFVGDTGIITAYLTDQIGPGTTAATDQIDSYTFQTPYSSPEAEVIFSGLTLAPGSYYLVMTGDGTGNAGWAGAYTYPENSVIEAPTITADYKGVVNVFHGTADDYAPASIFFDDTGDIGDDAEILTVTSVANTPEPSSLVLACTTGLFSGVLFVWRKGVRLRIPRRMACSPPAKQKSI
jgi:hypothetical protein